MRLIHFRMIAAVILIAAAGISGLAAQNLEIFSESGQVTVEWETVPGMAYRLQGTDDVATGWQDINGGAWTYGLGQRLVYQVYAFAPGGGGSAPLSDPPVSVQTFAYSLYPDFGKALVSWQGDYPGQALIDSSDLPDSLPPILAVKVPVEGGHYTLTLVAVTVPWQAAYLSDPSLEEASLSTDQQTELSMLTPLGSRREARLFPNFW